MNLRRIVISVFLAALVALAVFLAASRPPAGVVVITKNNVPVEIQESENAAPSIAPRTATTTKEIVKGRLQFLHEPAVLPNEKPAVVPVLMYHYIRPIGPTMDGASRWLTVSPAHFRAQMEEVAHLGYHSITPDELADAISGTGTLPAKPILITFDDGYLDQYTDAFPILKELGIKATFFIISAYYVNPRYQTNAMIQELDRSGLITIAAHTRHHVGLVDSKPDVRKDEIFNSKKGLEEVVGHPVTAFAYPYGNFNKDVEKLVQDAGYRIAFSTLLGSIHTPSSIFEARRIRVLDDESLEPILKKFSAK